MDKHIRESVVSALLLGLALSPDLAAQPTMPEENTRESTAEEGEDRFDFVIRLGEGGFRDRRSPINKLGGGQNAIDIKPKDSPLAISFSSEYYTNSADAKYNYEIAGMQSVNILYLSRLESLEELRYFFGGGFGRLEVPRGEHDPDNWVEGDLVNLEAGLNYLVKWKMGVYGLVKYLRAKKTEENVKVINFSERIFLVGITINFSL